MAFEDDIRRIVREELQVMLADLKATLRAPAAPAAAPALLTVEEVAARAGHVTPETVREWIRSKRLAARKAGHRFVVRPEDLERFLSQDPGERETIEPERHLNLVMERMKRAAGGK